MTNNRAFPKYLSIFGAVLVASCSTLTKPELTHVSPQSENIILDLNNAEQKFEKGVTKLRGSHDAIELLQFGGTVFGAYTALFTSSVDLQEAALITAGAGGAESLLDHSDKMEAVFRTRRRIGCIKNAALNVSIEAAKLPSSPNTSAGSTAGTSAESTRVIAGRIGNGRVLNSATSTTRLNTGNQRAYEKDLWINTIAAVWGEIATRFNNEWDGLFTDNTEAISKFEEAIKAIQSPNTGGGTESTVTFRTNDFKEARVKLLKCPLIQ